MNVILIAFALAPIAVIAGATLKKTIWSNEEPKSAMQQGRRWLSYAAFVMPVLLAIVIPAILGRSLIDTDTNRDLVLLAILLLGSNVLIFVFGYLYFNAHNPPIHLKPPGATDKMYEQVYLELESSNFSKAIWSRAVAESGGDKNLATSIYIKIRILEITRTHMISDENQTAEPENDAPLSFAPLNAGVIAVLLIFVALTSLIFIRNQPVELSQITRFFSKNSPELSEQANSAALPASASASSASSSEPLEELVVTEQTIRDSAPSLLAISSDPAFNRHQKAAAQEIVPTSALDAKSIQTSPAAPSVLGQWRCLDDEDVIDTFDDNGIYRRTWIRQKIELRYKWSLMNNGSDFFLVRSEIVGAPASQMKLLVLSSAGGQLEFIYPSGKSEKCKSVKNEVKKEQKVQHSPSAINPLQKDLIGKWHSGGWHFNYKPNGQGEIGQSDDNVCGNFTYELKKNNIAISNFTGTCKQAVGSTKIECGANIKNNFMTLKCDNGYSTEWNKAIP